MVYSRKAKSRSFVMRSVRANTMWRFLAVLILVCLMVLVFTISMEAGLRSTKELAGTGIMPVGLTLMV